MNVIFSPQRNDRHFGYAFEGEIITVLVDGMEAETFDFTGTPDGEIKLDEIDQGALPGDAVLHASREAGDLTVTLVLTHDPMDRAPMETRFPNNPYTVAEAETLIAARDAAL